jgi:serine/threonine protein kinase
MTSRPEQRIGAGRYRLLSSLGQGGFGEVFLAEGPQGLVAVKVVETASWSEREYQVFNALMVSEASFLSTLDHPCLPRLRDFFAEASRYFLVMDWVSGQTLEELVKSQRRLPLEETLEMLEQLLEALEYLHQDFTPPVIFGDLKPANVLRTYQGRYRLVDLGLATREGSRLTGDFAVYSPPYSPPEQTRGVASCKSHDIYSLAATTVYALTGHPPGPITESATRHSFASQTAESGPLARQRLGQLLTLLLAGLQQDPAARPSTLRPYREALLRWRQASQDEQEASTDDPAAILRSLYRASEGQ